MSVPTPGDLGHGDALLLGRPVGRRPDDVAAGFDVDDLDAVAAGLVGHGDFDAPF